MFSVGGTSSPSAWSGWSRCSVSCGVGIRTRLHACALEANPCPQGMYDVGYCRKNCDVKGNNGNKAEHGRKAKSQFFRNISNVNIALIYTKVWLIQYQFHSYNYVIPLKYLSLLTFLHSTDNHFIYFFVNIWRINNRMSKWYRYKAIVFIFRTMHTLLSHMTDISSTARDVSTKRQN